MDISASDLNIPVADIQDMLNQEATPMTFTQEDFDLICSSGTDHAHRFAVMRFVYLRLLMVAKLECIR